MATILRVFAGVDPAYAKPCAWATCSEDDEGYETWEWGITEGPPGYSAAFKVGAVLYQLLNRVYDVGAIAIESPYPSRAAPGLHRIGGAIAGILYSEGAEILYPIAHQWRAVVLADLRRKKGLDKQRKLGPKWKQLAIEYASELVGQKVENDDEAEAICLAQYARMVTDADGS